MANIAFFGTPEFSLPSLKAVHQFCLDHGHQLRMVVCQNDKEQGRGQRLMPPPIKIAAQKIGLPVFQPVTLRKGTEDGDQFFNVFTNAQIDLAVVVAYGKILSERLLKSANLGFVNVHASLLPRFRGAAPIQRAIEYGDKETGVCLMQVVKALDEGDVYACAKTPIIPSDTSETLFHRLANLGGVLLLKKLPQILDGSLKAIPQGSDGILYAHMLAKDEGRLNFNLSGRALHNKTRALYPWPGTYGFIRNKRIKFFDSFFIETLHKKDVDPGTVVLAKEFLGVRTIDGIIYFKRIQIEGKNIMSVNEALKGFPISLNEKIA